MPGKQTCRQTLEKYEGTWSKDYKWHLQYAPCQTDRPLDILEAI